eukprot:CAMPEP_0170558788 /NCGR_PEP_ID=MMETSP0211-20121228/37826_1 /TAXON_ID=311385 /ORGANISM="Pseudokeronopsis sp., Strain OXSARD2" /LENGTH=103 /DNA_ID=CAMNT_0010871073 /DNA_START=636 /DNA_END=947 /DNA_ORIENTATION=+
MYSEKDDEKNKLIIQKSIKLTELADKEKVLHEKEYLNKQLKEKLDQLKARFNGASDLDEEMKNGDRKGYKYMDPEENKRLDKKRDAKFQQYNELMAPHRIDES